MRPIRDRCRRCGQMIYLIKTDRGKSLPFDREEDLFVMTDGGRRRFCTRTGELLRGEIASSAEQEYDKITGWPCHFDTCRKEGKK